MDFAAQAARLGPPDLALAGLQVWVHGQPYAGSAEPYDADWLTVTVHCGARGASVWVHGAVLTSSAFERLAVGARALDAQLTGVAWLASDEPELEVRLEAGGEAGQVSMQVQITPDLEAQEHTFTFFLDQSHLPAMADACDAVLARYPNPHQARRAI